MKEFSTATWRIIHTSPASGAWNMALDEAILESAGSGQTPPTLRLYAWEPACLSLGYAQPIQDANQEALREQGWEMVRRPTGGRAILHYDELTYSVCGPDSESRLQGGVLASYRVLAQALLTALHQLNIPAQTVERAETQHDGSVERRHVLNPVCFEVPSNYEIVVNGKKLIGSAQARRKAGILQHGSLPLVGDLTRITQALTFTTPAEQTAAAKQLLARATTAETVLGSPLTWEETARAFRAAFQARLNLNLLASEPSEAEIQRAQELYREKYTNPEWTARV